MASPITPDEFAERMLAIRDNDDSDTETDHADADRLLCETLRSLGYGRGVDIFAKMDKWYA